MINNNPYNIPQRPQKQKRVVMEGTPLYPHQINRSTEELQHKQRHQMHKRNQGPYHFEGSTCEAPRVPLSPQPTPKPQMLQTSSVTPWEGHRSSYQPQAVTELHEKIASLASRLNDHDRKLLILMQTRKYEQPVANLTQSTSLSVIDNFSNMSRQMERYHSTDVPRDRMREEMPSYRSQNDQLESQLKESITQQIVVNFKESLQAKFEEQSTKIADYLSDFTENQKEKLDIKIQEVKKDMKRFWLQFSAKTSEKIEPGENKLMTQVKHLQAQLQQTKSALDQFQSRYRSFREEMLDNVLATQDHKRWLYEIDSCISKMKEKSEQELERGSIKVSTQFSMKQVFHLKYEEYLSIAQKAAEVSIKSLERIYLMDEQGYLLDANRFYLIDQHDSKIKLADSQIQKLRSEGLLK